MYQVIVEFTSDAPAWLGRYHNADKARDVYAANANRMDRAASKIKAVFLCKDGVVVARQTSEPPRRIYG
jgi:hypothetical protein